MYLTLGYKQSRDAEEHGWQTKGTACSLNIIRQTFFSGNWMRPTAAPYGSVTKLNGVTWLQSNGITSEVCTI